jgi:hypothetical protein
MSAAAPGNPSPTQWEREGPARQGGRVRVEPPAVTLTPTLSRKREREPYRRSPR